MTFCVFFITFVRVPLEQQGPLTIQWRVENMFSSVVARQMGFMYAYDDKLYF